MPGPQLVKSDPLDASQDTVLGTGTPRLVKSESADAPSTGHPFMAGLARLAGSVGSALTQPAELSGIGAAIPAGLAGLGEAAAEKLEGGSWDAPLDAKRIGVESALGAVPFSYLTKGKLLAGMLKSGAISGVGEAGREWAKGEDMSPASIAGQSALGAGTFGLLNKLFHGGAPSGGGTPSGSKMTTPPVISEEAGNKVFQLPQDWASKVDPNAALTNPNIAPNARSSVKATLTGEIAKALAPKQAPSLVGQHNFGNTVRAQLDKSISGETDAADKLRDLDKGIATATKTGALNRASNAQAETRALTQENAANLQDIKTTLATRKAAQLRQERIDAGLEPNTTFGESESGVDATGKRISKSTKYTPVEDESGGGDGGDLGDLGDDAPPENPLDALAKRLGMDKAHDPFARQRVIFGESQTPEAAIPEDMANADWSAKGREQMGLPAEEPASEPASAPQLPQSPVQALANVLKPRVSRSLKTVEGFNNALQKRIEAGGEPVMPSESNVVPGAGGVATEPTPAPTTPHVPDAGNNLASQDIADLFPEQPNTTRPHTGVAYRTAKDAFGRGEISAEDLATARDTHLATLGRAPEGVAGLKLPAPRPTPTGIMDQLRAALGGERSGPVAPVAGETTELPTGNTDAGASLADDAPDWVKKQSQAADAAKALEDSRNDPSQRGAANIDLLKKIFMPLAGAAVGGPVGSYIDPDDPNAGIKGAVAGGMLGAAGTGGPQGLINWRNAGLLATPSAQLKKPLSDAGAYIGKMAESALSGKAQSVSRPMLREMFNPENFRNYARAFKNPALAEDVIGDTAKPYIEPAKGLMGLVARPFAAAQYATSQAMQRAGVTPDEAKDTLLLGTPQTQLAQKWLDLQKLPGWQGQAVRAIRPFARIGTNLFERGVQRIPGPSMLTGDPDTRVARTLLGGGALAAGMATGASDQNNEDTGGEETSPLIRGLRRALLASYGIPFMAGEALTGPSGIRDLVYATPGATQTVPPPGPKDNFFSYGKKFGKRWLDQMMPDWATPQDWDAKPQR